MENKYNSINNLAYHSVGLKKELDRTEKVI